MRIGSDTDGVAVVVGAILIAGLLVALFAGIQVTYVPVWEEDAERAHMEAVFESLGAVRAALDAGEDVQAERLVPLTPARQFLTSESPSLHGIDFSPGAAGVAYAIPVFAGIRDEPDTRDLYTEEWSRASGSVEDVHDVHNFRLKIDEVGPKHLKGKRMDVDVFDRDGDWAGSFRIQQDSEPPNMVVTYTTKTATGEVVYASPQSYHGNQRVAPLYVDLLDPVYRFGAVLDQADAPLRITVGDRGLSGEFAIAYTTSDGLRGASPPPATGTPQAIEGGFWSGTLVYKGTNSRYLQQDLILENGALILRQSDGAAFRIDPAFTVTDNDEWTTITLTLPTLQGDATSVGGGAAAHLHLDGQGGERIRGLANALDLDVTTRHPWLWAGLWTYRLEAAGLSAAEGDFTVTVDEIAGAAHLQVRGDAGGDAYDLHLDIRQTNVRIDIR